MAQDGCEAKRRRVEYPDSRHLLSEAYEGQRDQVEHKFLVVPALLPISFCDGVLGIITAGRAANTKSGRTGR